jgi:hypothetical protein
MRVQYWDVLLGGGETCASQPDGEEIVSSDAFSYQIDPPFTTGADRWRAQPLNVQPVGGSCPETTAGSIFEDPTFATRAVACGPSPTDDGGVCEGEDLCVPNATSPFDGRVCIWQPGDVECPADSEYSERLVYHGGAQDDRACAAGCDCTAPEGTCSGGAFQVGHFFPLVQEEHPANWSCVSAAVSPVTHIWFSDPGEPSVSCDPVAGSNDETGQVELVDPVTFCCSPE